jgi:serine phosphatase RsbU (regulator of sigma subunit)/CBS domain-containing protein
MTSHELTVRQVMDPNPIEVPPDCTVRDALRQMNERRIGSVLVTDADRRLVGIFTERDLLRRVVEAPAGWRDQPVTEWMSREPHTIGPEVGWEDAVAGMHKLRVRHLPVIENDRVIGLLSTRGLMAWRTEFLNRRVEERTAELRQANEHLLARDAELLHNLRAAGRLQQKVLLPQAPPEWPDLRWAVHFAPLDQLGGDYYDFAAPTADHLGFLIADASGHSIPAALMAVMARFAFIEAAKEIPRPGDVLGVMNQRLLELSEERFVSAFYGVVDRRTGVFRYSSAGHPYPLLFEYRTGAVRPLVAQGFLLGIMPDEVYVEREVALEPGDRVLFYTDGLIEARNEIGEQFGTERLTDCLTSHGREQAGELLGHILSCQREFCGDEPPTDDLTAALIEVVPDGA